MIKYRSICSRRAFEQLLAEDQDYVKLLQDLENSKLENEKLCRAYTSNSKRIRVTNMEKMRVKYEHQIAVLKSKIAELTLKFEETTRLSIMDRSEMLAQQGLRGTQLNTEIKKSERKISEAKAKIKVYAGRKYKIVLKEIREELKKEIRNDT